MGGLEKEYDGEEEVFEEVAMAALRLIVDQWGR